MIWCPYSERRRAVRKLAATAVVAALALAACGRTAPAARVEADWFVDRATETGLRFEHFAGMSGGLYDPELIGPGVALFDYDNDGDLDVLFVQGDRLDPAGSRPTTPAPAGAPRRARLFRNDLAVGPDGTRALHFTDVTDQSGLDSRGYGMGVAIGDYDGDGCPDVYLTKFGSNQLFHNNCNGTFTDVTIASGTSDSGWSVPAVFFDFDRDGHPDLFVGHYLHYDVEHHTPCFGVSGVPDYCPPGARTPQPNRLFHNNGHGTFTDVTARAGMAAEFGGALGAVAEDFDGDGWPDLYVANDSRPNQLWINQRNGTFRNAAAGAGAALGSDGLAKASMGVDAGDFDNDGDDDIIVTTLTGQGSNLFVNQGGGLFDEQSARLGIHAPSLPYTGFGAAWFDFDNDGWLDLFSANGLVESRGNTQPIGQRMQLFRNLRGRFEDVTDRAGRVFSISGIGRGAAFGDIDNDGDTDIVVANDNGPARLLVNQVGTRNHWIGLRLVGTDGRREMVGARVECVEADGAIKWRRAHTDGSFASAGDPRVIVGLGPTAGLLRAVRVHWPDGRTDEWTSLSIDHYVTLKESPAK